VGKYYSHQVQKWVIVATNKELKNMRKEVLLNVLNGLYKSPENEVSVWKNVPITYLPLLKEHFKGELRYRPRGGTFAAYRI
jgi:hypothetical protein